MKYLQFLILIIILSNLVISGFTFTGDIHLAAIYSQDKNNQIDLKNAKMEVSYNGDEIRFCFLSCNFEQLRTFFNFYTNELFRNCVITEKHLCTENKCYIVPFRTAEVILLAFQHQDSTTELYPDENERVAFIKSNARSILRLSRGDWSLLYYEKLELLRIKLYLEKTLGLDSNIKQSVKLTIYKQHLEKIENHFRQHAIGYVNELPTIPKAETENKIEKASLVKAVFTETYLVILQEELYKLFQMILIQSQPDSSEGLGDILQLERNILAEINASSIIKNTQLKIQSIFAEMQNLPDFGLSEQEEGEEGDESETEESKISARFETPIRERIKRITYLVQNIISDRGNVKTNNKVKMVILLRVFWLDIRQYFTITRLDDRIVKSLFASFFSKAIFYQDVYLDALNILLGRSTNLQTRQVTDYSVFPNYEKEQYYLTHLLEYENEVKKYIKSSLGCSFRFLLSKVVYKFKKNNI
jgi:hypothetical protein